MTGTGSPGSLEEQGRAIVERRGGRWSTGGRRLELAGFSAARLAWYKAQGCFTEIIRYRTRLFVPVDRAAAVLARLGGA